MSDVDARYLGLTANQLAKIAADLKFENAKLRELCYEMLENLMPEICAKAYWCSGKDWHTCNDAACGNYTFVILAQELGVGVD